MYLADKAYGHEVYMVDAGKVKNGEMISEPNIGSVDDRGNTKIISSDPKILNDADIIIMHTGCSDSWIVRTQAPIIWTVHGRPLACFRPEANKGSQSYSLYNELSSWQRVKKMLYFWEEFNPDWNILFGEKALNLNYPVIDQSRFFKKVDNDFDFVNKGQYNFVIADSEREDICNYQLVVSLVNAVNDKSLKDLDIKFHFYGLDFPLENCWNILLGKLKETGKLGDIQGRIDTIENVYNKADCLISPNSIIVRTIAEAISSDCYIIAGQNCRVSDTSIDFTKVKEMIFGLNYIIKLKNQNKKSNTEIYKKCFSFEAYNNQINKVYKEIIQK
jgi:glycosyltransferase involved in cell wall biosynthesis